MGLQEQNKVWRNTTITGIVREIGLVNGFDPAHVNAQLAPDPPVLRPLHQDGKTDLAFLQELAEEHHARCFVELDELGQEVLHFIPERRAVTLRRPDQLLLRYRSGPESNLLSFSPAFDATDIDRRRALAGLDERGNPVRSEKRPEPPQADVVWALDPLATARANPVDLALINTLYTAGSRKKLELHSKLAAARVVVGAVAADQAEISDKDDSLESRRLGQSANGTTFGNIWLRAKTRVTIQGVASRFAGDWYVASATHRIDGGGYRTDFKVVR
jgi:phage protein D